MWWRLSLIFICQFSKLILSSSHNLKTRDGRIVTCPVLRKYVCNLCSASGDHAHTLRLDEQKAIYDWRSSPTFPGIVLWIRMECSAVGRVCHSWRPGGMLLGTSPTAGIQTGWIQQYLWCCGSMIPDMNSNIWHLKRMLCPPLHSALRKEENDFSQVLF